MLIYSYELVKSNLQHPTRIPSWKSSDPKIIGIKTYLFENFGQKKGSRKF